MHESFSNLLAFEPVASASNRHDGWTPEKQKRFIHELSLIAFPTRERFQEKINVFQLIIYDRFARQGVGYRLLPTSRVRTPLRW